MKYNVGDAVEVSSEIAVRSGVGRIYGIVIYVHVDKDRYDIMRCDEKVNSLGYRWNNIPEDKMSLWWPEYGIVFVEDDATKAYDRAMKGI